jgi:hypothetical protein
VIGFVHASLSYDWDHLRHFLAWAFNPDNWFTNASEQMIAFIFIAVIGATLWPPLRRAVGKALHRFVDAKLKPLHDHLTSAREDREELHRKLDHIIEHHPDIPAFPRERLPKE